MKKDKTIEVEEQIFAIISEKEIVLLKHLPSMIYVFLFIGLVFFIGFVTHFLVTGNIASLLMAIAYVIVVTISFIRKRVVFDLENKTITIQYVLGSHVVRKLPTMFCENKKLSFVYRIEESSEGTNIWFELQMNYNKIIDVNSLKGVHKIEKIAEAYFKIVKSNFPAWYKEENY